MTNIGNLSIKTLSGRTKAVWAVLTAAVSVIAAVISTTTYINGLIEDIHTFKKQVAEISEQLRPANKQLEDVSGMKKQLSDISDRLKLVSGRAQKDVEYNGYSFASCDPGSFLTGLSISVDGKLNSHGKIECAGIQPIVR